MSYADRVTRFLIGLSLLMLAFGIAVSARGEQTVQTSTPGTHAASAR